MVAPIYAFDETFMCGQIAESAKNSHKGEYYPELGVEHFGPRRLRPRFWR
jgi:hypothetical protein